MWAGIHDTEREFWVFRCLSLPNLPAVAWTFVLSIVHEYKYFPGPIGGMLRATFVRCTVRSMGIYVLLSVALARPKPST